MFLICLMCWGGCLFLKGYRRLDLFLGFFTVWHSMVCMGSVFFPKTISAWNRLAFAEAPSLTVFKSNFLNN